jgi:hypothetical protein
MLPAIPTTPQPDGAEDDLRNASTGRKIRFSSDQDALIKHLAESTPTPTWTEIAGHIPNKSSKQCRERYQHFLAPDIQRQPWSPFDDARLLHWHHFLGSNWAAIAQFFPGRTNNDVKNRFNGHLKGAEMETFFAFMDSARCRTSVC